MRHVLDVFRVAGIDTEFKPLTFRDRDAFEIFNFVIEKTIIFFGRFAFFVVADHAVFNVAVNFRISLFGFGEKAGRVGADVFGIGRGADAVEFEFFKFDDFVVEL